MSNIVLNDRIVVTNYISSEDDSIITSNPTLPVYPDNVLSTDIVSTLGRISSTEFVMQTSQLDNNEDGVLLFNSTVVQVQVLLPVATSINTTSIS